MKSLNVMLEDAEHAELSELKDRMDANWRDAILAWAEQYDPDESDI